MKNSCMKPLIRFEVNIQISIKILILLTVMNLNGLVNIFVIVIVIYGNINNFYHIPKSFVL